VISIIEQIQASITGEARWLKWVWRKCKRKARYTNIQDKSTTPPQTKPLVWQTPGSKLKRAAIKTHGFSMAKIILPLKPRQENNLPSNQGKSNQASNSIKDANSPWSGEPKVLSIELKQTSRQA
jgi:hypothetical protein